MFISTVSTFILRCLCICRKHNWFSLQVIFDLCEKTQITCVNSTVPSGHWKSWKPEITAGIYQASQSFSWCILNTGDIKVVVDIIGEYQVKPHLKVLIIGGSGIGSLMSNYKLFLCFPSLSSLICHMIQCMIWEMPFLLSAPHVLQMGPGRWDMR